MTPSMFFLTGIPGLEDMHPWISIPFSAVFTIALLRNSTLLYMMKTEPSLHKPMVCGAMSSQALSMLAVIDLVLSLTTMPKMLIIFWFNAQEITFSAHLVQMFFLHAFSIMVSVELLAMAFNKYVAICNLLSYKLHPDHLPVKNGLLALVRAARLMLPLPFLLRHLPYCRSHIISHCYWKHMAVVELACANTRFSNIMVVLFILGLFIGLSYLRILRTVLRLALKEDRLKVFGTCLSHICVILVFYTPVVLSSVIHRFGCHVASHMHILMANFFLPFPPMVYGVKTKQIHDQAAGRGVRFEVMTLAARRGGGWRAMPTPRAHGTGTGTNPLARHAVADDASAWRRAAHIFQHELRGQSRLSSPVRGTQKARTTQIWAMQVLNALSLSFHNASCKTALRIGM
ncbi:LOW QUALITY PROTEIN: hypothetical protein QYF61_002449 [Mycteria americana]|uniref:G-protein coupled receptors family 1 profile domain-containing protein n=1 Tax=Mycteria americana TaxID=33587 RepID=A0AAN7NPF6_MYCAM|nr:LOW QUALITY PROTEIN: hypothetical protein QYF61_002449 [Mycteria americana]